MKSIQDIQQLRGTRVLVRVDFNVPMNGSKIRDTYRIDAAWKTIQYLKKQKAVQILISHIGSDGTQSLAPAARYLAKKTPITFLKNDIGSPELQKKISSLKPGSIVLLENIRRYSGEEKNTGVFAKQLASLAEYYVNDAFSVSHRMHASIAGVAKLLPAYAGFQLEAEVHALSAVVQKPAKPFVFILGGAKFSTKIPLINRFLKTSDKIVLGGALLNNFYKVAGFEVGKSVVESGYDAQIKQYLKTPNVLLPIDVVVLRNKQSAVVTPAEVLPEDIIVDIGPQSIALLKPYIEKAKLIVWNGPLGWYEKGFVKATIELGKLLAKSKVTVVVGGGDTVTVLGKAFAKKKNIFVSTGGGATIDYLANGTIPGVELL